MRASSSIRTGLAPRLLLALASIALLLIVRASSLAPRGAHPPAPVLDEPRLVLDQAEASAKIREPSVAPSSIPELRAAIAAVLEREQVPGVGLALVDHEGLIWAGGVGVRDLDSHAPVTEDTVFRVASITKSVVALGAMTLVERGALELDAPLAPWMPEVEWANPWAEARPLTLAHMLEHTAGFDDMHFNEYWTEAPLALSEALAHNPRSRTVRWQPSSRMSYSNPGYTVAGYAIEKASGQPWDHYLQREVLEPLGMNEARFHRTPELRERLATGYLGPDQPARFDDLVHAPAGALLTTPRELAALVHFWLRRGQLDEGRRLLSPASLARIERTETLPYPTPATNYGLGNYGDVLHRVPGRGHDGGLPGFWSSYRYFPELGLGYVMLLNATHSASAYVEIRRLLFAYLTRGRQLPVPPRAEPDGEAIAAATGYYRFASPRHAFFGFLDRTLIGMQLGPSPAGIELELLLGARVELIATGPNSYRLAHEGGSSLVTATNEAGEPVLVAGMAYFERGSRGWAKARLFGLQAALLTLQLALLWGLGWLLSALVRRIAGRPIEPDERHLQLRSLVVGASFVAMLVLLQLTFASYAFTSFNGLSAAVCASTLVFPAATASLLAAAVRAQRRRGQALCMRLVPSATAIAGLGVTLVMLANGLIGLRLWAL